MTEQEQKLVFDRWTSKHRGLIFKIVRAYAFSEMDRDDLFQEIALQVWRSIPSFKKMSAETTWIYRVALNTAIQWVKKERRHALVATERILVSQEGESGHDEQLDWLYKEIHKLNEIDRSVTLLMLDNLSYKEMAIILGITESNVGVKINRIKKHLIAQSKNYNYGI